MTKLHAMLAKRNSPIPFEEFMRLALYHPEFGFYMRPHEVVGPRGAFSTLATRDSPLAPALLAWLHSIRRKHPRPWHVVEVGAGDGSLANSFLHYAGWLGRRRLQYHIVEISPSLRMRQQQTRFARSIQWHNNIKDALLATKNPVLISNELVDAFPCRPLAWKNNAWHDVLLQFLPDDSILESLQPAPTHSLTPFTATSPIPNSNWPPPNQRIETHPAYFLWLKNALALSPRPMDMLTIDYGHTLPLLYHRRPMGTLRAYFHHIRLHGPEIAQRAGLQDITADANFSDLISIPQSNGLSHHHLSRLDHFLHHFTHPNSHSPSPQTPKSPHSEATQHFFTLHQTLA